MQNFSSFSTNDNDYFEEIQNMVNNNQQYALENGSEPVKDKTLSKLKKFKLTSKYCKKDENLSTIIDENESEEEDEEELILKLDADIIEKIKNKFQEINLI